MTRYAYYFVSLGLVAAALPLRAADRPHAGAKGQNAIVWTNDDLDTLHSLGLISIVGQIDDKRPTSVHAPEPSPKTQDSDRYAVQAAKLRDEIERRQTQILEYRQAIDDARSLRKTIGGINFDEGDIAITPDVGIEILERRVNEVQTGLNALDDLARHHDIPPGALRGQ
jgi:hypothetical protein